MKIRKPICTVLFLLIASMAGYAQNSTDLSGLNNTTKTVCPVPNGVNKSIVEDFLTKSYWSSERTETNTGSLTISQITLLTDSSHSNACTSFNTNHQESLNEENSLGEPAYNVTYYKAGSFYFVVITLRQSDNPNLVTAGVSFIAVYNQNLNLIKGYAF